MIDAIRNAWVRIQRRSEETRTFQSAEFDDVWDQIDSVGGWLSPNQEKGLFNLVCGLPNDALIVEVGSFLGRSTVSMGFACRGTARRIIAIDTFQGNSGDFVSGKNKVQWEGNEFFSKFTSNLCERGLDRHVIPLRGFSHAIGRFWASPIDMLFLDGSHAYEDVMTDVRTFIPWVRPGGCVALHDVTESWHDVYRVWHEEVKQQLRRCGNVGSLSFGYKPMQPG